MAEMIPVNIVIGDRTYRIKTEAKDEEKVRKTIKLINEKIIEFKTQFAGKDMQDYIAMVIIWYATQAQDSSPSGYENSQFIESLKKLELLLDKSL
ncbi:MAG TPA: cell division protein ZapA [Ferruginibacter sp.]|jgi:cell division protein ZapA|nr:cell division protein ZapA [Bacteroidota bacterium]MBS1926874.1 cell division protein ZapA [Bacteroidota bacterium]MCC6692103.1 cell division protein ZapA [Chitinophagaceae bacterium]HMT95460.1 cell division protein ZapA [Ferruginibacter sp.]HMU24610.1 cell division protein ZapA [Ferruginibacter sp.]